MTGVLFGEDRRQGVADTELTVHPDYAILLGLDGEGHPIHGAWLETDCLVEVRAHA